MNVSVHFSFLKTTNMEQTIEQKRYFEISLAQILKFIPYRKLLFCVYLMFSHKDITPEDIQQNLNKPESFEDFKRLWWSSIRYMMEKETTFITYDNWKKFVAENPKVIEFLYKHRRSQGV